MLGMRSGQLGYFEADHLYLDFVGRDTFYGFLASLRGKLFRDEDFAPLYVLNNGRPSVPPSLMAMAVLLQCHDRVSDQEAKDRADFDLRWKVAMGIGMEDRPFAKSTLQLFRSQLVIHEMVQVVFCGSLRFAKERGYLTNRKMKAVLDTSYLLGRGAVKDTYNLLADGIVKLAGGLAGLEDLQAEEWAESQGLGRYFGSSIKGEAGIDWDSEDAKQKFLGEIVGDADRLLEIAREKLARYGPESKEYQGIKTASQLLEQLLLQDVERTSEGVRIKQGVAKDRVISVHDPEMRHGRKSKAKRFDGHKQAVVVDGESGLITAAAILPGNAPDSEGALDLVKQAEANTGVEVEETIGDCAYGDGATREAFAEVDRELVAKVAMRVNGKHFSKEAFQIDPVAKICICPAGQECTKTERLGKREGNHGKGQVLYGFRFAAEICAACPLRGQCVKAKSGKGRTVSLHPQEALLQKARAFQKSEAFAPYRQLRQVVEHRLGRLVQLGMRQARYFGRVKTLFQLLIAATVANLTLVAGKTGLMRAGKRGEDLLLARKPARFFGLASRILETLAYSCSTGFRRAGFRPGF